MHQPNGKTGSVVADVEVPDYAKTPLTLSGVALASAQSAADRALLRDETLEAVVGSSLTARRRFAGGDTITAYAEAYAGNGSRIEEVRLMAALETSGGRRVRPVSVVPIVHGSWPDRGDGADPAGGCLAGRLRAEHRSANATPHGEPQGALQRRVSTVSDYFADATQLARFDPGAGVTTNFLIGP